VSICTTSLDVKRFSPKTDLLMAALGDVVGREYILWSRGILDRLPPEVGHTIVDGWVDGDQTVIVTRDLGHWVLTWKDRLTREHCRSVLIAVSAQHRAFLGVAPDDLLRCPTSSHCLHLIGWRRLRTPRTPWQRSPFAVGTSSVRLFPQTSPGPCWHYSPTRCLWPTRLLPDRRL
jgi:hypothetical protein